MNNKFELKDWNKMKELKNKQKHSILKNNYYSCDMSENEHTLKLRITEIFSKTKKRNGAIIFIVILLLAILSGSIFVFSDRKVSQVNDSLIIYTMGHQEVEGGKIYEDSYQYDKAIEDYKLKYPDIKIELKEFKNIEPKDYFNKLSTEIMAGGGPDVIIADERFMHEKDINKMMQSGAFASMDDFIANDTEYNQQEYYQGIMKSGFYRDERYILPMRFNIPIIASGENALKAVGINSKACTDNYVSFMQELSKFKQSDKASKDMNIFDYPTTIYYILDYMGVNPTKENPTINTEEFKSIMESYKVLYEDDNIPFDEANYTYSPAPVQIKKNKLLFAANVSNPLLGLWLNGIAGIQPFDTPVIVPLRKPVGGINANITIAAMINANSKNQQNAYNFIQLLNEKPDNYFMSSLPLNNDDLQFSMYVNSGSKMYISEYNMDVEAVSQESYDAYLSIVSEIDNANFITPVTELIKTEMKPYLTGEKSYDECITQAQEKVNLYFAE